MAMDIDKITMEMGNISMKPEIELKLKHYKPWVVKILIKDSGHSSLSDSMRRSILKTRVKYEKKGYLVKHHRHVSLFIRKYNKFNTVIAPISSDEEEKSESDSDDDGEDTIME